MKKIAISLLVVVILLGVSGCMKKYSRESYINASAKVSCLAIEQPDLFKTDDVGTATIKDIFKENGFPSDDNEKMMQIITEFKADTEATDEIIEMVKNCQEEFNKKNVNN